MNTLELTTSGTVNIFKTDMNIQELKSLAGKVYQACSLYQSVCVVNSAGVVVMTFIKNNQGKVGYKKFRKGE